MQGVIIENISNLYSVKSGKDIYKASARGKLKKDDLTPVVGDVVDFQIIDEQKNTAVIEKIHKRKMYIKRPKLSNLTQIILVISIKHPKPDLLMLDKQLAFAELLKIKPIIVINKIDLDTNNEAETIRSMYEKVGYTIIKTDTKNREGLDSLKSILVNNVSAFSGNSGVGKSSLINCLFEGNITPEGEVSAKNKKGKNTTTSTKLYEIAENSFIADTPGFSTFDIGEISYKDLEKCFIEFKRYTCEYVGCTHVKENECKIKEAVEQGKISKNRYNNYCKIYLELKDKEEHKW